VLKVKVKVKGHVIRALSGMSYSVIDGLVIFFLAYCMDWILIVISLNVCEWK